MDQPLIPKSMPGWQKAVVYGLAGGIIIYFVAVVVVAFLKGRENEFMGNYVSAAAIVLLLVSTFVAYKWLPHDVIDARVTYVFIAQGLFLVIAATGLLIMSLEGHPKVEAVVCPGCYCPACPTPQPCPPVQCDLSDAVNNQWLQMAGCFSKNPTRAETYFVLSPTKTCPAVPPATFDLEKFQAADHPVLTHEMF